MCSCSIGRFHSYGAHKTPLENLFGVDPLFAPPREGLFHFVDCCSFSYLAHAQGGYASYAAFLVMVAAGLVSSKRKAALAILGAGLTVWLAPAFYSIYLTVQRYGVSRMEVADWLDIPLAVLPQLAFEFVLFVVVPFLAIRLFARLARWDEARRAKLVAEGPQS